MDGWKNEDMIALIKTIRNICSDVLKEQGVPMYVSAIVDSVNSDGTVNVFLPPDKTNIVTNKMNYTGELLEEGDSVELCCKKGRLADSWIATKHKTEKSRVITGVWV